MSEPTVCAICLTRDRPSLAAKAVECFREQTYENKRLLVYDTGDDWPSYTRDSDQHIQVFLLNGNAKLSIGALRNNAIDLAMPGENIDILIHWDDDDWSHPNRIAEQVALLQASGADCVGYNEMLFWRTALGPVDDGEAWLYRFSIPKPTLGTSLCYWRKTWERKPFLDIPKPGDQRGEDRMFIEGLKVFAISSVGALVPISQDPRLIDITGDYPRMIARIHSSNSTKYNIEESTGNTWTRVPSWDKNVRQILINERR